MSRFVIFSEECKLEWIAPTEVQSLTGGFVVDSQLKTFYVTHTTGIIAVNRATWDDSYVVGRVPDSSETVFEAKNGGFEQASFYSKINTLYMELNYV